MKTISTAMRAALDRELVTLTTLWTITRQDGVIYLLTDHDQDVEFNGATYTSSSSYSRSTVASKGDFSVDNLDLEGILDSDLIKDSDLRDGLFDFAEVRIRVVDWTNPDGLGDVKQRRGWTGEIQIRDNSYVVELRGMTQVLARRRGRVYTPDCKADWGSPLTHPLTGNHHGCGVDASLFKELSEVETVTGARRVFTVPPDVVRRFEPTLSPAAVPEQQGCAIGADGVVRLLTTLVDEGTPNRSIGISTPAELNAMRNNPQAHYHLENDIDMGGFGSWTPIPVFRGVLDGRGHYIWKLAAAGGGSVDTGMFERLTGVCRRVGFLDCTSNAGTNTLFTAIIAGRLAGSGATGDIAGRGLIEDCWAYGGSVNGNGNRGGGLVGRMEQYATLRRCVVSTQLLGAAGATTGGLVALTQANSLIENCYWNSDWWGDLDAVGSSSGIETNLVDVLDAGLTNQALFTALDFNDLWKMGDVPATVITASFLDLNPDAIGRTGGDFLVDGVRSQGLITTSGAINGPNNGTFRVRAIASVALLTLDAAVALTAEASTPNVTYSYQGPPVILDPGRF